VRDNPLMFGRYSRGMQEFLLMRRALLNRWGVSEELQAKAGPAIEELMRGDDRMKASALRSMVMLDQRAAEDQRDVLLAELNSRLKQDEQIPGAAEGGGREASPPEPDGIAGQ
jgi:hypothetical protein